jgi:formyltetrahydrofolate synthetase
MNITVGNYETKNFDIYTPATVAFAAFESDEKHVVTVVENAAKFVDAALGIMKKAMAIGTMGTHDFDEFIENVDKAEELLDSVDELDDHYYLRDNLEAIAVEMYDLSDVDTEGHAEDCADEEAWMFGPDDGETEESSDW